MALVVASNETSSYFMEFWSAQAVTKVKYSSQKVCDCVFAKHLWQQNVGSAVASGAEDLVTTPVVYTCKTFGIKHRFVLYLSVLLITFD